MAAPLLVVIRSDRITIVDSFLHYERIEAVIGQIYPIPLNVASNSPGGREIFCRPNSDTTLQT